MTLFDTLFDLDLEERVLGGLMLFPEDIPDASMHIQATDFHSDAHRLVFDAMVAVDADERKVDPLTVSMHLRLDGSLEAVGGHVALARIVSSTSERPTPESVDQLGELSLRRRAMRASEQWRSYLLAGGDPRALGVEVLQYIDRCGGSADNSDAGRLSLLVSAYEAYFESIGMPPPPSRHLAVVEDP